MVDYLVEGNLAFGKADVALKVVTAGTAHAVRIGPSEASLAVGMALLGCYDQFLDAPRLLSGVGLIGECTEI